MEFDITLNSLDSCDVLLYGVNTHWIVELVDGLLKTKLEELVLEFQEFSIQL